MASPRPQPTALKILKGETRKERLNLNEPKPQPVMPECPMELEGYARETWDKQGPVLVRLGILTEADGMAFAALCKEWSRYVGLSDNKELVQTFETGARQVAPEVSASHKCLTQLIRLFAEFGLTPSSRARLSIRKDEADEFGDLI